MRRPKFQLGKRTEKRLETIRPRMFGACQALLLRIGQYCVDRLVDEVDECVLRRFPGASAWRVVRHRLDALLDSGALELTPWGYAIPYFQDDNLPAYLRAKRNEARRRNHLVEITNGSSTKSPNLPLKIPCIVLTGVQGSRNLTNNSPVARSELRQKSVPAAKSVVSEETGPYDFEAACRRMAGAGGDMGGTPKPAERPNLPAIDRPKPRPAPMRPHRAARMPKTQSLVNEGVVVAAVRDLGLAVPADLFSELYRHKATDVEVGYAVWCIQRQRERGNRIAHPIPYLLGIVMAQRRYRMAA